MSDIIITPTNNGPYHVQGKVKLRTSGGREIAYEGEETWLCRCGQSGNRPFCDGTHNKCGFQSAESAPKPG